MQLSFKVVYIISYDYIPEYDGGYHMEEIYSHE